MKKDLHLLAINMFFIQKLINNNLFKNNHIIILWNVLQVISFLSIRAYFKGRAYIKIILKNHARSYFAGRSYYRGNTVLINLLSVLLKRMMWSLMGLLFTSLILSPLLM